MHYFSIDEIRGRSEVPYSLSDVGDLWTILNRDPNDYYYYYCLEVGNKGC